jgi:hypothetical protein
VFLPCLNFIHLDTIACWLFSLENKQPERCDCYFLIVKEEYQDQRADLGHMVDCRLLTNSTSQQWMACSKAVSILWLKEVETVCRQHMTKLSNIHIPSHSEI